MKVTIRIREINYGDVALKAMPLMQKVGERKNNATGKIILAISNLPDGLIYDFFDAIPVEQKNEIAAAYATENKEKFLGAANKISADYRVGITLSDYTVDQNLVFTALIEEIDYQTIAEKFLPEIRDYLLSLVSLSGFLKPVVEKASAKQICDLLDKFLGKKKESVIVSLMNKNQLKLISLIEETARKWNIGLKINSIIAEV